MSEQNPYQTLGLAETASFEEIQAAKQKLSQEHKDDVQVVEDLEAAYDAIIMARLRQRQEGTLNVPDQIRFAEAQQENVVKKQSVDLDQLPDWVQNLFDTPEPQDLYLAFGLSGAIALGALLVADLASTLLTVALVANVYLLNRKEKRFGRSVLLGIGGLVVGIGLGSGINALLAFQNISLAIAPQQILVVACCGVFGLSASFLR